MAAVVARAAASYGAGFGDLGDALRSSPSLLSPLSFLSLSLYIFIYLYLSSPSPPPPLLPSPRQERTRELVEETVERSVAELRELVEGMLGAAQRQLEAASAKIAEVEEKQHHMEEEVTAAQRLPVVCVRACFVACSCVRIHKRLSTTMMI